MCACYSPTIEQGAPCDPNNSVCPSPQTCQASAGQYVCTSTTLPDARPIDAVVVHADARIPMPDAAEPTIAAAQAIANSSTTAVATLAFPARVAVHDAIIVCLTFPSGSSTLVSIT